MKVESNYRADAVSPKGAMGLMQLMPATARQYAIEDPFDPVQNLTAGLRHLRGLLDLDRDVADGLWVAQDTGGAIRGANRFDTFWGAGTQARETAGGMSGRGSAVILLPRDSARRLGL